MTAPRSAPSRATCRCSPSSATIPGVRFDPRKFVWLGSSSNFANDAYLLMVRNDAPVKSIEEARRPGGPPLVLGSTAEGTSGSDVPMLLRNTLGLNIKLVAGYPDNGAIFLAVDRGEVNGRTVDLTTMKSLRPDWLKPNGGMRALVQFARATRHPDFPDVPTARELATRSCVAGADRARGTALHDGAPLRRAARRARRPRRGAAGGLSRRASRSAISRRCGAARIEVDADRCARRCWQRHRPDRRRCPRTVLDRACAALLTKQQGRDAGPMTAICRHSHDEESHARHTGRSPLARTQGRRERRLRQVQARPDALRPLHGGGRRAGLSRHRGAAGAGSAARAVEAARRARQLYPALRHRRAVGLLRGRGAGRRRAQCRAASL